MNPKNVLVTGGTGFVGANLVEQLVRDGHRVHLFVRDGYKDWRIRDFLPHLQIHPVNLLDPEALRAAVTAICPDWVFHLAAYGAYSWQREQNQAVQTNFFGTMNLVEACRSTGFDAFIHSGSSSEYGAKARATSENDLLEPNSDYAVTKASATMFCRYTAQRFKLPIFTLRLYSVFGPYEEPGRLIPTLILKGLQGQLPPLAHPETARDFIFTEDVTCACISVAVSGASLPFGEIYNVGSARQTTLKEVVETTREIFQISNEPIWGSMQNRAWDTEIWRANNAKLRATGWQPTFNFRAGYLRTIEWFRQNPHLVNKIYNPI
jgi:nucleoside-diphosphate-sugar epimerase